MKGKKTGGRVKGSVNKKTLLVNQALLAASEGAKPDETPLQLMLRIMRVACPKEATPEERLRWGALVIDAANKAAPYVHPRLAPIEGGSALGTESAEEKAAQMRAKAAAMRDATHGKKK